MASYSWLLEPKFWLPRNVSWHQLPPVPADLLLPILAAPWAIILRVIYEAIVGIPLAYALGYCRSRPLGIQVVEHLYGGFASKTKQKRVLECFFRGSAYTALFFYGCYVMADKSWLYDVKQCWIGYPFHPVPTSIWWYYMFETTFYWSLLLSSTFDVRRADYWQLVGHHIVTIGLLSVSWVINFVRVGTLILLSHDLSDVFLELGKLVRYDGHFIKTTNGFFIAFLSSWIVARLIYFPFVLIRSAFFDGPGLVQPDYDLFDPTQIPYAPRFVIFMLFCLLGLHIFWTFLIVNVVIRTLAQGQAVDDREESDDDDGDGDGKVEETKSSIEERKKHR